MTQQQKDEAHHQYFLAGTEYYKFKVTLARQQHHINERSLRNMVAEDDILELSKKKLRLEVEIKELQLKE